MFHERSSGALWKKVLLNLSKNYYRLYSSVLRWTVEPLNTLSLGGSIWLKNLKEKTNLCVFLQFLGVYQYCVQLNRTRLKYVNESSFFQIPFGKFCGMVHHGIFLSYIICYGSRRVGKHCFKTQQTVRVNLLSDGRSFHHLPSLLLPRVHLLQRVLLCLSGWAQTLTAHVIHTRTCNLIVSFISIRVSVREPGFHHCTKTWLSCRWLCVLLWEGCVLNSLYRLSLKITFCFVRIYTIIA